MNTPNILILYTGGTIGMVQDAETGSLKVFDFKNIYDQIPRLAFSYPFLQFIRMA